MAEFSSPAPCPLEVRGLSRIYRRGGRTLEALKDVDFQVRAGEITALVGPSGSGKSTLGRCLALLEAPDAGEVRVLGQPVDFEDLPALRRSRRRIQLVFQDAARSLSPYFTVRQALTEPFWAPGVDRSSSEERLAELSAAVSLSESTWNQSARSLSGGQAQRLALARALATDPRVLILDESFAGLDLSLQARWVDLLLDLMESYALTCVLITHDLNLARQLAPWGVEMEQGRLCGAPRPWRDLREPSQTQGLGL